MMGIVSVVVPTRNRRASLSRSIESVLAQTHRSLELIIVDDASTDGTDALVSEYTNHDGRVRYVRLPEPGGANAARNLGVGMAHGEYVAFQDSDDVWLPRKLERQVAFLAGNTDVGAVGTRYVFETPSAATVYPDDALAADGDQTAQLARQSLLSMQTLLVRRDVFDESGGLDANLRRLQDWEFVLRMSLLSVKLAQLPEPLVHVYGGDGRISNRPELLPPAIRAIAEKMARLGATRREVGLFLRGSSVEVHRAGLPRDCATILWKSLTLNPTIGTAARLARSLAVMVAQRRGRH